MRLFQFDPLRIITSQMAEWSAFTPLLKLRDEYNLTRCLVLFCCYFRFAETYKMIETCDSNVASW